MDSIHVGYFLEDIAQENFLKALVERIAQEIGFAAGCIRHEVRNATGGRAVVLDELHRFLRDVAREREPCFEILVVAIDGNCRGHQARQDEIRAIVQRSGYPGAVVCAVPDPHIERWYLADPHGFQQALGTHVLPQPPSYKCERGRYKEALRRAVRQTGVVAPLGGIEYGPGIAATLDLYRVGRTDTGFKHFIDELRGGLTPFATMQSRPH